MGLVRALRQRRRGTCRRNRRLHGARADRSDFAAPAVARPRRRTRVSPGPHWSGGARRPLPPDNPICRVVWSPETKGPQSSGRHAGWTSGGGCRSQARDGRRLASPAAVARRERLIRERGRTVVLAWGERGRYPGSKELKLLLDAKRVSAVRGWSFQARHLGSFMGGMI